MQKIPESPTEELQESFVNEKHTGLGMTRIPRVPVFFMPYSAVYHKTQI